MRRRNDTRARFNLIALFLALLPLLGASPSPAIFRVFVYAPAQQDSPLHIAGLQYDEGGFIRLTLLNTSTKRSPRQPSLPRRLRRPDVGWNRKRGFTWEAQLKHCRFHPMELSSHPQEATPPAFTHPSSSRTRSSCGRPFRARPDCSHGSRFRGRDELEVGRAIAPHTIRSRMAAADAGKCPDAEAVAKLRLVRISGRSPH